MAVNLFVLFCLVLFEKNFNIPNNTSKWVCWHSDGLSYARRPQLCHTAQSEYAPLPPTRGTSPKAQEKNSHACPSGGDSANKRAVGSAWISVKELKIFSQEKPLCSNTRCKNQRLTSLPPLPQRLQNADGLKEQKGQSESVV